MHAHIADSAHRTGSRASALPELISAIIELIERYRRIFAAALFDPSSG
jgi:hypothetical protein